jgi:hypothetical protein
LWRRIQKLRIAGHFRFSPLSLDFRGDAFVTTCWHPTSGVPYPNCELTPRYSQTQISHRCERQPRFGRAALVVIGDFKRACALNLCIARRLPLISVDLVTKGKH